MSRSLWKKWLFDNRDTKKCDRSTISSKSDMYMLENSASYNLCFSNCVFCWVLSKYQQEAPRRRGQEIAMVAWRGENKFDFSYQWRSMERKRQRQRLLHVEEPIIARSSTRWLWIWRDLDYCKQKKMVRNCTFATYSCNFYSIWGDFKDV